MLSLAMQLPIVSVITVFIGTSDCLPPREITLFIIKKKIIKNLFGYFVLTSIHNVLFHGLSLFEIGCSHLVLFFT